MKAMTSNRWLHDELTRYRTPGSHQAEGAPRMMRGAPGMHRARAGSSVVLLDLNVVVDVLDAFCLTRNGHGLVDCLLGSGAAAQPHHAVLVRIDRKTPQAGDMFGGQLGFDLRRDGRILYEDLRLR